MKHSTLMRTLAAILLAAVVIGCKSNQPTAPQGNTGSADAIIPLTFYHIKDSDGGKAGDGVDVVMLFEPNGIADLYLARATEAIAYKGSYSVSGGKVSLKFTDADFKPDVSFTIDTSQATVTMPFKVFKTDAGTSQWQRARVPVEQNLSVIFNCATLAENLPTDQALDRVTAYTNAMIQIGARAGQAGSGGFARGSLFGDPKLTGVQKMANGVQLQFDNGPYLNLQLFGWVRGDGVPLTLSTLAGDPRVHLDPASPHDGTNDPEEKTALFIAPFDNDREGIIWYDQSFYNRWTGSQTTEEVQSAWGGLYNTSGMESTLTGAGYTVQRLNDADASVSNIIEALIPGKGGRLRSPGFVTVISHGGDDGSVSTGTILGVDSSWRPAFSREETSIKARGYGDLLTYGGGTEAFPRTICAFGVKKSMLAKGGLHYSIGIMPKFWEWLRTTKQANFSKSFVYISACLTDSTDALRMAIKARAYFGFSVSVKVGLAAAIFQYFCTSLARPTHSAEECYYNIIRVFGTGQMIYKEDKLLDSETPVVTAQGRDASKIFHGYGFDGQEVISYQNAGWLKTASADPGAIWWLLFGGRWGQDAKNGAAGLKNCWDEYWSSGNMPGLANPDCQNKAPGRPPTANELAYASYLLTGTPVITSSVFKIPRWTLNDGR
ncbi:MAG TPA: hypothetical protein VHI13_08230 [Candidatus Kapabacteria bacterium]|nr:hypothetical protein [Candidatus Kapabacteria bacterium]